MMIYTFELIIDILCTLHVLYYPRKYTVFDGTASTGRCVESFPLLLCLTWMRCYRLYKMKLKRLPNFLFCLVEIQSCLGTFFSLFSFSQQDLSRCVYKGIICELSRTLQILCICLVTVNQKVKRFHRHVHIISRPTLQGNCLLGIPVIIPCAGLFIVYLPFWLHVIQ